MLIEGKIGFYKRNIKGLFEVAGKVLKEDFSAVCVSVNFVDESEIKRLNKEFRDIDKCTDVLSFPNLNKVANQSLDEFDCERNIDDNMLFLGDIVICKKMAYAQSKEYGHSKKREICFLALHGLLHLLGYDHIESEEEKVMQETARKILTEYGVER